MTDKEVFEKFMSWMNMKPTEKIIQDSTIIVFEQNRSPNIKEDKFTSQGYEEFYAGAIFDKDGNLVKGYLDSHVTYSSKNCDLINNIIRQL